MKIKQKVLNELSKDYYLPTMGDSEKKCMDKAIDLTLKEVLDLIDVMKKSHTTAYNTALKELKKEIEG